MKRLALLLLLCMAAPAGAQSFRGTLTNMGRYIEIRPITRDTVDSAQVTTRPDGGLDFEGRPVVCLASVCTFYRPLEVEHAITTTHDLSLTAWGFGIEGVSFTTMLRARSDAGGDFTWPRSDDPFDAILAYADFAREKYRVRAGRQRAVSGLGFYSFDGVDALYQATDAINLEFYVGRSLARALEQPRNTALGGLESFVPGEQAWLIGGASELSVGGSTVALRYQREILSNRGALLSERASIDVASSQLRPVHIEGAADYDVGFGHFGKAHLTARLPLHDNRINIEVTGRRYMPFFELWTIWGMFSPIAYHEAELQAGWAVSPWLGVWGRAAYRKYEDADAPVFVTGPKDDAKLFGLRARVDASSALRFDGDFRLENSFGAYLGSGELSAGWRAAERLRANAYVTAFQQILEFRTGEAAVLGFGASVDYDVLDDIGLSAGGTIYQQRFENRPTGTDWNQKRAWASLEWRFGRDPGMREEPR